MKKVVLGVIAASALSLSVVGHNVITRFEGTRPQAYLDTGGIATICTGHTGPAVRLGLRVSQAQCEEWLREDTEEASAAVRRLVKVPLTQGQFDALVSFTFNLGAANLSKSTLLKYVNKQDCARVVKEFGRWVYDDGRILAGLQRRRAAEARLFAAGVCPESAP